MAFGINDTGFEIKRLADIIEEKRALAVSLFQDLLEEEGDFVDTSDSSALGRLISLATPSETTIWEQLQLAYSSLDPNTAVGIALDNIVQYGGISRQSPSYSTVTGLFSGDIGTVIPTDSVVSSGLHANTFRTIAPISIATTSSSGVVIEVNTLQNSTAYTVSYTIGVSTNTITFTSDGSATVDEILNGIGAAITLSHPLLSFEIVDDTIVILKEDIFTRSDFTVTSNLVITKGYKTGSLQAEELGDVEAEANSLNVIDTPVLGWDTVTNPLAASPGNELETDEELRLRFRNTKFERSTNILDSLYSALINVSSVESVTVYENDTDVTDGNGLPPHSLMAVVLGGESEEVANAVYLNKPAGISTIGDTTVEIIDSQGFPKDINFERPTPVPIYIAINLTTDSSYPADGDDQIKAAIINYAQEFFKVGADIVYTRLYTPINEIQGHQVDSLFIGTAPAPTGEINIPIAFTEIGSFSTVNITIT